MGKPPRVNRLIIHQFDAARPSPGGIDTCLRGICRYAPSELELAFVGVDAGAGPLGRELGKWEHHQFGDRSIWFLPVVHLDPADQRRRLPHSLRLILGVLRYWPRLPSAEFLQSHRMDTALALLLLRRGRRAYFIHTQEGGLTGKTSDSFWKWVSGLHELLERFVVKHSEEVVVFNEDYAARVATWNTAARFFPTWYDPRLIKKSKDRDAYSIVWVGRLEEPKDPGLAVRAFAELVAFDRAKPWRLEILGSGTLFDQLSSEIGRLPGDIRSRIELAGRVSPEVVGQRMGEAGVFLMTSHPGYEGFPRVLVEAMASGLRPVVTFGSDTGGLVKEGLSGFVASRDPREIARLITETSKLKLKQVEEQAASLSAPAIVGAIFEG